MVIGGSFCTRYARAGGKRNLLRNTSFSKQHTIRAGGGKAEAISYYDNPNCITHTIRAGGGKADLPSVLTNLVTTGTMRAGGGSGSYRTQ
jgi:hypothetical protein